jgi:hypothetical protein
LRGLLARTWPARWTLQGVQRKCVVAACARVRNVICEARNHEPILGLIETMLTDDGVCWLGDGGREVASAFVELAHSRGFDVELRDAAGDSIKAPYVWQIQLILLTRRNARR